MEKIKLLSLFLVINFSLLSISEAVQAKNSWRYKPHHNICTKTAKLLNKSCQIESYDDFYTNKANCINLIDRQQRWECLRETYTEQREQVKSCKDVFHARVEVCDLTGGGAYDVSDFTCSRCSV